MRSVGSRTLGFRFAFIIVLGGAMFVVSAFLGSDRNAALGAPEVLRGHAAINGSLGSGISGEAVFTELISRHSPVSEVRVVVHVVGLEPGRHGFHVHESGVCAAPFTTAGGHFDPGPFGSSTPVDANHPYHAGDLPNLEVNAAGVGHLEYVTSRFTLRQNTGNALSALDANGSAVIVHLNEDLGLNGIIGASGGPRIACGVIELD